MSLFSLCRVAILSLWSIRSPSLACGSGHQKQQQQEQTNDIVPIQGRPLAQSGAFKVIQTGTLKPAGLFLAVHITLLAKH